MGKSEENDLVEGDKSKVLSSQTSNETAVLEPSLSLRDWINSSETSGDKYASHFVGGSVARTPAQTMCLAPSASSPNNGQEPFGAALDRDGLAPIVERTRDANNEEEGDAEEEEDPDPYLIPKAMEAVLEKHSKTVSTIAVDKTGSRVISGANDGKLHLYDFEGMKKDMKAFRKIEPNEGHQALSVSWSPSADCFLSVTTSAQAKVFDRDGRELGECVRGDMYLHDVRQTKGHTAGLTGGQWHPTDRDSCLTCSEDGTVRVWDITNVVQKTVIKPSLGKPGRVAVSTSCFNHNGSMIAAGMMDGTIQLWSAAGKVGQSSAQQTEANMPAWKIKAREKQRWMYNSRPGQLLRSAHEAMTEITGLCFAEDGKTLISRGGDETLQVWDLRNFKKPLKVFGNLPCNYATTGCALSPDQQLILTGVSCDKGGEGGGLVFFDASSLDFVKKIPFSRSVCAVHWHDKLNQIFVGLGDKSYGEARILYDPELSTRGALVCASRVVRSKDPLGLNLKPQIYAPNALPMYQENWSKKRARDKDSRDPIKTKRPDPGSLLPGHGKDGKLGQSGKSILTQHLLKTQGALKGQWADPRKELLKHADGDSSIILAAYHETQPKPVFAEEDPEEEAEMEKSGPKKVDPGTGMYIEEE